VHNSCGFQCFTVPKNGPADEQWGNPPEKDIALSAFFGYM
jgi:hypothetical protein